MAETQTRERGILMNGPMAQAAHEGRKTQTRRPVKDDNGDTVEHCTHVDVLADRWRFSYQDGDGLYWTGTVPKYQPGDLLYVRETWMPVSDFDPSPETGALHRAAGQGRWTGAKPKWRPSIHMPKWAARTWLRVTDVRVERVQEISEADAQEEGVYPCGLFKPAWVAPGVLMTRMDGQQDYFAAAHDSARAAFACLWKSIYGHDSWNGNDWVWAYTFERIPQPEEGDE